MKNLLLSEQDLHLRSERVVINSCFRGSSVAYNLFVSRFIINLQNEKLIYLENGFINTKAIGFALKIFFVSNTVLHTIQRKNWILWEKCFSSNLWLKLIFKVREKCISIFWWPFSCEKRVKSLFSNQKMSKKSEQRIDWSVYSLFIYR